MPERMSNVQAVLLSRAIRAGWPHQRFDEATTDLWAQGLRALDPPLRFEDCEAAITRLVLQREFAGPAVIVEEVRRIRDDRLDRTEMPVPNTDPDDPIAHIAEIRALRTAIADGVFDRDRYVKGDITLSGYPARPAVTSGPEVSKPRAIEAATRSMFAAPPTPSPADFRQDRPLPPPTRTLSPEQLAVEERERARQLRALEAMMPGGTP